MKTFKIENKELPTLLIGSSPFCGSRQFKEKAPVYFERFYNNPSNITDLLVHFVNRGYEGAHLIPAAPIAGAALEAYDILGKSFPVILTLMAENEENQWEWIDRLDTVAVFLHAFEADKLEFEYLKRFADTCREHGVIPCVSTHNGGITIPRIDAEEIDIAGYLVPFNKTGAHVYPSLEETLKAIMNSHKTIVGMKILSCGNMSPEEAFPFSLPMVEAVTVGMVEKWEIDENCRIFEKYHDLLGSKKMVKQ